ncbi:hypothetical protein H0H93_009009 [Arthromyces matolae]|nr:hypothetical protein H0H93_009009 [Arthromyces matolae]
MPILARSFTPLKFNAGAQPASELDNRTVRPAAFISKEESQDDGSGVHDFLPEEADLYLEYPQLMLDIVGYIRRELVRLEKLSDQQVMRGPFEHLKFGRVRP